MFSNQKEKTSHLMGGKDKLKEEEEEEEEIDRKKTKKTKTKTKTEPQFSHRSPLLEASVNYFISVQELLIASVPRNNR